MSDKHGTELPRVMRVAKDAARGSVFIFAGNTLSTVILTVASVIIARLLGPSNYGLYSVALIVPSLMLLFTDFGVKSALVRFTAKFHSEGENKLIGGLVKTGLLSQLAASILMFLLTFLLADTFAIHLFNRPDISSLIRLSSLLVIGNVLVLTSNNIFIGLDKMDMAALISVTRATVKIIFAPILIILGFSVVGTLVSHILGYLTAGVIGTLIAIRILKHPKYTSSDNPNFIPNLILMIRYGIPLYTSTLVAGLLSQYQSVILAWFTMNVEIGNYSAATMFLAAIMLITNPISTALFPAFSKLDPNRDLHDLRSLFKNSLKYTLILVIPASTFIAVNSKELITFFYGSTFTEAPLYLTLYSITFLYTGFSLVLGSFFNGVGRTDISLKTTLIQLPTIILLAPTLTWLYKVQGFIIALIISGMPPLAYLAWTAHSKYTLNFIPKTIMKICSATLLSSTPALVLTLYLPYSSLIKLILASLTFTLAYLTLTPMIGVIEPDDIANLTLITKDIKPVSKLSKIVLSYDSYILSLTSRKLTT
jgi:stage V sporulation protein B